MRRPEIYGDNLREKALTCVATVYALALGGVAVRYIERKIIKHTDPWHDAQNPETASPLDDQPTERTTPEQQ